MRLRNGFIELTWKEALAIKRFAAMPWWARWLAPLQHAFACTFMGHRTCDLMQEFPSAPIPRTSPPRCDSCFHPLGSCVHDPDRPFAPLPE